MTSLVKGKIFDVEVTDLNVYPDGRGSLVEMWRMDDNGGKETNACPSPWEEEFHKVNIGDNYRGPVMSYLSWTKPGIVRGLHQHLQQVDNFYFAGPGLFKVVMIDDRKDSPTQGFVMEVFAGSLKPRKIVVPTMVYHGYKNVSLDMGLVVNFPTSLFMGWQKKYDIDENRYDPHELAASFGYSWEDKDN